MHQFNFSLSFRVNHPKLSSSRIVALIGKKPSVRWDVGANRKTPKGTPLKGVYDRTYVCFPVSTGRDSKLIPSLRHWNRFLLKKKAVMKGLRRSGGRFDYFLGVFIDGNGGMSLTPDLLREIGVLGVELGLDLYAFAEKKRRRRA